MDLPKDIDEAAKIAAGNWKNFESFGWSERPDDAENWCIFYTSNRDSELLEKSNEKAINKELEKFDDDVFLMRSSHWAYGYVDQTIIRVYKNGEITDAFERLHELCMALSSYPVLDESDYSEMCYEEQLRSIENEAPRFDKDPPDDWIGNVWRWLSDNKPEAFDENWASRGEVEEACIELGYYDPEDE